MRRTYSGTDIEVTFDRAICIHVGACLAGLSAVFELRRRPWILPDAASADAVAEVVQRCPSGALRYRRLDGEPDEQPEVPTAVTPVRNGPIVLRGELEITQADGSTDLAPRATLCRCGQSANKPYCDNSHLRSDFEAPGGRFNIPMSPVRIDTLHPIAKSDDPRD